MIPARDTLLVLGSLLAAYTTVLVFHLVRSRLQRPQGQETFGTLLKSRTRAKDIPDEDTKMVILVRRDLGMGRGKIAAQCGHAVACAIVKSFDKNPSVLYRWLNHSQAKVALRVDSLEELELYMEKAKKAGLVTAKIRDAGHTQVEPDTVTVLGIGPDITSRFEGVTSDLKLLN